MLADISDCGNYRYTLSRHGDLLSGDKKGLLFLMLNPSTADAHEDDSTITRCRSFAASFGFDGFSVGNLYALRSTDPLNLWKACDPVGPENDNYLKKLATEAKIIVCAWGNDARAARVIEVCSLLKSHSSKFRCLQLNKSGMPRHPLYVRGDRKLTSWYSDSIASLGQ